jgi:hypothetical protein
MPLNPGVEASLGNTDKTERKKQGRRKEGMNEGRTEGRKEGRENE